VADFFILLFCFSTAYSKNAENIDALCEHKHADAFCIHWQQYR